MAKEEQDGEDKEENEKEEHEEDLAGKYTQLVFQCAVCKRVYKKPGMCNVCDEVLKPKGG